MVALTDYTLIGAFGPVPLVDVFDGRSQLFVYQAAADYGNQRDDLIALGVKHFERSATQAVGSPKSPDLQKSRAAFVHTASSTAASLVLTV